MHIGLASFPGLPTVQFFDRLQHAKTERSGPFYDVRIDIRI